MREIREGDATASVSFLPLDLCDLESVRAFADLFVTFAGGRPLASLVSGQLLCGSFTLLPPFSNCLRQTHTKAIHISGPHLTPLHPHLPYSFLFNLQLSFSHGGGMFALVSSPTFFSRPYWWVS